MWRSQHLYHRTLKGGWFGIVWENPSSSYWAVSTEGHVPRDFEKKNNRSSHISSQFPGIAVYNLGQIFILVSNLESELFNNQILKK